MKLQLVLENTRNKHLLNLLEESDSNYQVNKQLITEAINFLNKKLILENYVSVVRELITEDYKAHLGNLKNKVSNGATYGVLGGLGLGAIAAHQYLNSDNVHPDMNERINNNLVAGQKYFETDPNMTNLKENSPIIYNSVHDLVVDPSTAEATEIAQSYGTGAGQGAILGGVTGLAAGTAIGSYGAGKAMYQKGRQIFKNRFNR